MNTAKTVSKYSFFSSNLTRALKISNVRIHCNVDDDGTIYVCNGYFAVKLTGAEYDALVRPVTQRDAGKWILDEYGNTTPDPIDLAKAMNDAAMEAVHTVTAAPMFFDASKGKKSKSNAPQLVGYYSESGDFVTAFNSHYAAIVSPSLERKSKGSKSPMVVYDGAGPVAMICPVYVGDKPNITRAVRAWFIDETDGGTTSSESAERLIRENDQLRHDYDDAQKHIEDLKCRIETLNQCYGKAHADFEEQRCQVENLQAVISAKNEQIETLVDRLNAQPDPQPQEAADVQPQDKAAALVEKLTALPGVTAMVKGAQTAAPVVWLTGETDAHKDKIEEMGGKWSGKRSAWYFKIA